MIAEAPLVFIGRVEDVGGPEWAGGIPYNPELEGEELQGLGVAYYRARFAVARLLRGGAEAVLDIALINCEGSRHAFEIGESYLVFAEPRTFGGAVRVIAPMGYAQGVYHVSGRQAHNESNGTVDLDELPG